MKCIYRCIMSMPTLYVQLCHYRNTTVVVMQSQMHTHTRIHACTHTLPHAHTEMQTHTLSAMINGLDGVAGLRC